MKKSAVFGIIFNIVLGALLHFTYEWTGDNSVVGAFSAVNESTWEHLKLLYFPYLIYTVFEYTYLGGTYKNFITAKLLGAVAGLIAIPVIFNTYTDILGTNLLVFDLLTFVIGVIISYAVSGYIMKRGKVKFEIISIILLLVITFGFVWFTYNPPHLDIFLDPVTGTYGI